MSKEVPKDSDLYFFFSNFRFLANDYKELLQEHRKGRGTLDARQVRGKRLCDMPQPHGKRRAGRQTDRQTGRQAEKEADRQAGKILQNPRYRSTALPLPIGGSLEYISEGPTGTYPGSAREAGRGCIALHTCGSLPH